MEEAAGLLNQFRAREGAELVGFIREQNTQIRSGAEELQRMKDAIGSASPGANLEKGSEE